MADGVVKKGTLLGAAEIERLRAAGIDSLVIARLEPGDVPEDEAARRLAEAVAGEGVRIEKPFTGRSNLYARHAGVLVIDVAGRRRASTRSTSPSPSPRCRPGGPCRRAR